MDEKKKKERDPGGGGEASRGGVEAADAALEVRGVDLFYGQRQVLFKNTLRVPRNTITALIGPTNSGKSVHLRLYNRLFNLHEPGRVTGEVFLNGEDVFSEDLDVLELRRRVGMVFSSPALFPMTVFDNVAYGIKLHYRASRRKLRSDVERALVQVDLWDDLRHRLDDPAYPLTRDQKKRLCLARALAVGPEVLLFDDPTLGSDPAATAKMERIVTTLEESVTVLFVTSSPRQASRVSSHCAFMSAGRIVEFNTTQKMFQRPERKETEDYITGRFG